MIPSLNALGLLPPGEHQCSLKEVRAIFGQTPWRVTLLDKLDRCIRLMKASNLSGVLLLDGSFVTDKTEPGDIDVVLDVRRQNLENQQRALWFYFSQSEKLKLDDIHWFPTLASENDFNLFFQYAGEKTAALKQIPAKHPKGILRIQKW